MKVGTLLLPEAVDLENYGSQVESGDVRVETNIVRPISFSDGRGRGGHASFTLPPLGIIQDAVLVFATETSNTAHGYPAYYPGNVGLASAIDEISLTIGGKKICSTNHFGHFFGSQRGYRDMDKRRHIDMIKYGTNDFLQVKQNHAGNANDGVGYVNSEYNVVTRLGNNTGNDNSSTHMLHLSDMFKFFNTNFDIPAYLLNSDQQIQIHIRFRNETDWGSRQVISQATNTAFGANTCNIVKESIKLIVDNVFLDEPRMAAIRQSYMQGQVLSYTDLEATNITMTAPGAQEETKIITFNGAGKKLVGWTAALPITQATAIINECRVHTHGIYNSYGQDRIGYNVQINNKNQLNTASRNMLPSEVIALLSTFNPNNDYIEQPKGLTDFLYGNSGGVSDTTINTSAQNREAYSGIANYLGFSLGDGIQVSNVAPTLELYRNRTTSNANLAAQNCIIWAYTIRYFSIRDGRVSISY